MTSDDVPTASNDGAGAAKLIAANVLQSVLAVLACLVVGLVVSVSINFVAHPKATGYHWGYRQTGVSEDELAAHEATRSSILTFAWVTGLLASQSAFLIRHLAPRPPHPADGAPGRPSYLDR